MNPNKTVTEKLRWASLELGWEVGEVWEELIPGYVDNIPPDEEIIEDIEGLVERVKKKEKE